MYLYRFCFFGFSFQSLTFVKIFYFKTKLILHMYNLFYMVAYFCHHLSDNYVDLSDLYVDLSDNFVVICMALTGQAHVFKIWINDKSI